MNRFAEPARLDWEVQPAWVDGVSDGVGRQRGG